MSGISSEVPLRSNDEYDYASILKFVRDEVRRVCPMAIPEVQARPGRQGVSFGNVIVSADAPTQESELPLAQEAHSSLGEVDALITGGDRILGATVEEYPSALPMGKLLSGAKVVAATSYQTLGAKFLDHPAVVSTRVKAECRPAPTVNVPIANLELLETSKMIFQVNNHLGTFLFGLDKAAVSLPAMAKGCLEAASKASTHIAQLTSRLLADNLLLRRDHYLVGLRAPSVIKSYFRSRSVRETLLFGSDFNLVMDKEALKSTVPLVTGNTGKRRSAIPPFRPPPMKKQAFFKDFRVQRVSEAGKPGSVATSGKRGRSHGRTSRYRPTPKGKAPGAGKQSG